MRKSGSAIPCWRVKIVDRVNEDLELLDRRRGKTQEVMVNRGRQSREKRELDEGE